MYVVGFYSPRQQSGVTELSLAVATDLRTHFPLKVAFLSNSTLQKEPITEQTIHRFGDLTFAQQKKKLQSVKKSYDVVIFDASGSTLFKNLFELLPLVDRLFIVSHSDAPFAEALHQVLEFNKQFNPKSRDLVNQLHSYGNVVLREDDQKIGFTSHSDKDIKEIREWIYRQYHVSQLHNYYIARCEKLVDTLTNTKRSISEEAYDLGLDFEKAMLLERYIALRQLCGQSYQDAIETILPIFLRSDYNAILQKFQNEYRIAQISFQSTPDSTN
jgi:hypothetical protein